VAILERTEREMPNAFFGLGRGYHAQTMAEIMLFFRENKEASWKDILDRFKLDATHEELSGLIHTLERTGRIKCEKSQTERKYVADQLDQEDGGNDLLDDTIFSKRGD